MNETPIMTGANPTLEDLQIFLNENFDFRYNVLTDMPECKPKNTNTYRMIDKRMMNSLSYKAMMQGIDCKDADVKRFLFSDQIATHHPFKEKTRKNSSEYLTSHFQDCIFANGNKRSISGDYLKIPQNNP